MTLSADADDKATEAHIHDAMFRATVLIETLMSTALIRAGSTTANRYFDAHGLLALAAIIVRVVAKASRVHAVHHALATVQGLVLGTPGVLRDDARARPIIDELCRMFEKGLIPHDAASNNDPGE